MLEAEPEFILKIFDRTYPFAGLDGISDSLDSTIGSSVICIRTKNQVIKKIRTSRRPDVLIFYKGVYEFSVYPASRIIDELFEF
ncbi:hypothetical protein CE91St62_38970 [Lachnospiraceae bacterium]|uniref:hypothetical protein n=1 Tax=Extibacter sp. GGCC_0201 TaxID=2731209 RepID=UPI001AA0F632|nr:hypothetical protein [Extibacter sp. GGCC_0201]BDF35834.1 hypothetical protein CE91St61_39090 [Lachnospiraceae bacterium]BDF39836.1 hypothetical protein CE91St62_38970 [Lachnospiraceae bacterium]